MERIVVGYDGSEHARKALERAAEIARGANVTVVTAIHVLPHVGKGPGSGPVDRVEAAERRQELADAKAFLEQHGIETRAVAGVGDPARVILEEAKEWGADLIVVGSRGLGAAGRLLLGSVSTSVVQHAPCDVLVVR